MSSNASDLCFKEKWNIFQCFNVPFINDDLLLGEWGWVGGKKQGQLPGSKPSFPGLDFISVYCCASLAGCKAGPMYLGFLYAYFYSCVNQKHSHQEPARAWHQALVRDGWLLVARKMSSSSSTTTNKNTMKQCNFNCIWSTCSNLWSIRHLQFTWWRNSLS